MTESAAASESNNCNKLMMSVNNFDYENGKLKASIKWLITRIYTQPNTVPDTLQELFTPNNNGGGGQHPTLSASVIECLTNASFYCQAASRIFRDASILTNNISSVFNALTRHGIDIQDSDGYISEEVLSKKSPFNLRAHLLLIDALMHAQLMESVLIDKVVRAISNYTAIEKREEPLDSVDALLFWIHKICLLVRDDVERHGIQLVGSGDGATGPTTIPEMEDLYEDLCDGSCICTLISFYRPDELPLQEICFNDPMSVNDCRFNLELLRKFCSSGALPWNPFHFDTDDILYLHESLQPNVNSFLADLFYFFEGQSLMMPTDNQPEQQKQTYTTTSSKSFAEVRLEMEGLRRQLQKRQLLQNLKQEQARNENGPLLTSTPHIKPPGQQQFASPNHPPPTSSYIQPPGALKFSPILPLLYPQQQQYGVGGGINNMSSSMLFPSNSNYAASNGTFVMQQAAHDQMLQNSFVDEMAAFRLHETNAPISRLDQDDKRKKMEQELGNYQTQQVTNGTTRHVRTNNKIPRRNGDENATTPRVSMPISIAEPTLKWYAKQRPKTNRLLIVNSIQHSVFPGHVCNENRQKAQAAIADSDAKHFLVLFRNYKCQYRGIYTWDQFSDTVHKIEGLGPKICKESMMTIMYKYDSCAKSFGQIPTKHLSATIDAFVIAEQYWQKPIIPHSSRC